MRTDPALGFQRLIGGGVQPPSRQVDWLMEGRITAVDTAAQTVTLIIPEWSTDYDYKNISYGSGNAAPPSVGDKCLVGFVGNGPDRAWLLSWWGVSTIGGGGSSFSTYEHIQAVPSDTWTITHNLNCYPSVTVVDSSGSQVVGDVHYVNANQVVVTFNGGFGGKAFLN